jgi:hypothetical protein
MDLLLSAASLASFAALIVAWVAIPHHGRLTMERGREAGPAQAIAALRN